jgi:Sec-independent protein secretion pathway component TatC
MFLDDFYYLIILPIIAINGGVEIDSMVNRIDSIGLVRIASRTYPIQTHDLSNYPESRDRLRRFSECIGWFGCEATNPSKPSTIQSIDGLEIDCVDSLVAKSTESTDGYGVSHSLIYPHFPIHSIPVNESNAFTFICTNISELFQTSIEITIQFSFCIFIPFFLYNIWVFLIPSLYCFERKKWTYDLYIYILLYILAIFLSCIVVFPFFWKFFMHFQEGMLLRNNSFFFQLQNQPRISSYFSFFFHTEIITHFFCETPFFFYLLLKYNYIQIAQIIKNRRIIYFNLLLFIALISPPEILTQILFFIITIFLFEFLIFFQISNQKFN